MTLLRHLISLCTRTRRCFVRTRTFSTQSPSSADNVKSPPPHYAEPSDEHVLRTIRKIQNPDLRFLIHNTPRPLTISYDDVMAHPMTRATVLPNGLRIASESRLGSGTASIGVFIDAYTRYEMDGPNGTAHFLEHMVFNGTEERMSTEDIEAEIENIGGHLNAGTSREFTHYIAKVMDRDVTAAVDILSDMLQNSKFDEEQIEYEKYNIQLEKAKIILDQYGKTSG